MLPNGDKYQGEFREGGQTGEGNLYSSGKLVYRGQWKNGVMEGVGDFYNSQGKKIYSGGVALNERSGFGAAFGADGKKVYDGQWSHGVREGFGQAYGPDDKVVYEGSWSHDKENGTGRNMRFGTIDWIITDNEKVIKTESRETTYMTEATYRDGVLISKGRELVYIGDKSKDGLPHGKGILAHTRVKNATQYGVVSNFANIYEGEFQQGKMTGYGKMYDDNGLLAYDGQLVNGLRDGKGQSFEKGLLVYDGDWIQNVEQGTGRKYTYESDAIDAKSTSRTTVSIQEGDFEKGKLTKAGRIMKYYGPLWNGRAHGTGYTVLLYDPNSEYNTSTLPLSDTFTGRLLHEGEYKDGYREGTGKLYDYKNRLTYDGEFKKGLREGTGKEYDEDTVYTGPFVNDQKNGVGKIALISDPTIRFEGEFKDNVKSGHGREYYTDGNLQFDGEYKAGKRDGYGQIYHSNGVIYYQGLFREGVPVDKNVGDLE